MAGQPACVRQKVKMEADKGIKPFVDQCKQFCSKLWVETRNNMCFQADASCKWDDARLCSAVKPKFKGCRPTTEKRLCLRLVDWEAEAKARR
jgi:hypothetical protein